MQGIVFDIKRFALHDGPGIRTTVFLKGCPLRCRWCHNPEGIAAGISHGAGKTMTVDQVMLEIEKETLFYDESGGGATFSGGEPLLQPQFLAALLDACRQKAIHSTVDTCGGIPPLLFQPLIPKADLFLFDVKLMHEEDHIKYTGLSNRDILVNLETLVKSGKNMIARFPLIPGITDSTDNITAIARCLTSLGHTGELHVLPYHRSGENKYRRLKMDYPAAGIVPPTDDHIEEVIGYFKSFGLSTRRS